MELWEQNRGKKPHKFTYTYQDIALLTGLTLKTVRKYAQLSKYNPSELKSVVKFIGTYSSGIFEEAGRSRDLSCIA